MQLTRRDATAALAALGATGAIAFGGPRLQKSRQDDSPSKGNGPTDGEVKSALIAVAAVVYPTEVSSVNEFVDGFLEGRLASQPHADGIRSAVTELDELARSWYDAGVTDLSPEELDRLLRDAGADSADEDPSGTTAEQIRYYVVNELLLALYASPKGGELVGIENPQGHPGGTDSYGRGP